MPRDTIEKAVKKGAGEAGAENYESVRYEGYASGGVAVIVECLVANVNKTAPEIRTIFDKNFGSFGVPGSVSFGFQQKGVVLVTAGATTEERLFEVALDAGAEDIAAGDEGWQVTTSPADLARVRDALEAAAIAFESAEVIFIPATTVEVGGEEAARVTRLVSALEEHDDVQKVHINADIASD